MGIWGYESAFCIMLIIKSIGPEEPVLFVVVCL